MKTNVLYYGDNLDILRGYIPDESVDLVYLDPPFNSNRDYNVIFKDESGRKSDAQMLAFEDTWHWGPDAEKVYDYLTNTSRHEGRVPDTVSTIIAALRHGIGANQMMAYLVEMAARLVELHRVLKPTGSLYLHCDPTASHYLKIVLDAIFGPENYRNEIIWIRSNPKSLGSINFPNCTDTILRYTRGSKFTFHQPYGEHDPEYVKTAYHYSDARGRYRLLPLLNPNDDRPNLTYEFLGVTRVWRWTKERMQKAYEDGLVVQIKPGAVPQYKKYLEDSKGRTITNCWADVPQAAGNEALGYPTQKPAALLERIIAASSNPGDIVLDPFCGCGTALVAAEKLGRKWIGIDITYLSIAVMKARLKDSFGLDDVEVIGQPTETEGARQLLTQNDDGRYQFQWWALGLVDAKPLGGTQKKGSDKGVDGKITFTDEHGKLEQVIVSVKSGHVDSSMIRDLKGTLEREKAAIGLFITLEEPTSHMKQEAATAGLWHSNVWNRDYPRIQLLSIHELLEEGHKPGLPSFVHAPYQRAERVELPNAAEQSSLFGDSE
jgi:site-specific DNA-methyltransferase (adenine-specific)